MTVTFPRSKRELPTDWRDWPLPAKMRLRWRLLTDWNEKNPRPNQLTPGSHVLCTTSGEAECAALMEHADTLGLDPIERLDWLADQGHIDWLVWYLQAGRGFGKTRVGAEDIAEYSREWPGTRLALVGATLDDVRLTMVEGESGLLSVLHPSELRGGTVDTAWNRTILELWLANGTYIKGYSAERPDRLRGPQHHRAWADELAAWKNLVDTWDMLQFGLRLVPDHDPAVRRPPPPQTVVTTTPKPKQLLIDLRDRVSTVLVRGSTYDNLANLAPEQARELRRKYEGTRLGRQELHGELIEEVEAALWSRSMIEVDRYMPDLRGEATIQYFETHLLDKMRRVVIGVDPAVSNTEDSDETGIVAAALAGNRCPLCSKTTDPKGRHAIVFGDLSGRFSPDGWAKRVSGLYVRVGVDKVVAEKNNGGDLVEAVLRNADRSISYRDVWAKKGKVLRAQPVSHLYEKHRVHHLGVLPELEDQQCTWDPDEDDDSPDRLDALVYALTDLCIGYAPAGVGRQDRQTGTGR